jgi:hypothetical protein
MCSGKRRGRASLRANVTNTVKDQSEVYENYQVPFHGRGTFSSEDVDFGIPKRKSKRKINSRAKGQRGELEVRDLLRAAGFEAERGQQRAGGSDSPDVKHNIPGYHIEVKLCEQFNLFKALAQATQDNPNAIPLIFHRRNYMPWMVCLPAEVLLKLLKCSLS